MNAYEMVSRVGRELHAYIFSSGIFPLNNVLAYLREGEMNVSSRLKWPIVRRKFDSVAGVAEYRLGATENRMESPVLDDLIIGVRVKDSSSSAFGEPLELTTFLGQLAGAQAVKILGNTEPISKPLLVKSGMSLLNF